MTLSQPKLPHRFWAVEITFLVLAVLGALALVVGALTVPFYNSTESTVSSTSTGPTTRTDSATLVQVNGIWVLWLVATPLIVTLVMCVVLWRRTVRRPPGPIAWVITGLMIAVSLVGILSIGALLLPITVCLAIVVSVREGRSRWNRFSAHKPFVPPIDGPQGG